MENKHFKIPLPLLEASGSGHASRADGSVQERAIFVTHPTCWHSLILSTGSHGIYFRIGTIGGVGFHKRQRRKRGPVNPRLARKRVARGSRGARCLNFDNRSIERSNERTNVPYSRVFRTIFNSFHTVRIR